jgi:hypothetical protein
MLAACGAKDAGTLKPPDAARWLHQTCGITFARDPVILVSASASPVAVSATVSLPSSEEASALESLRNNRSLHSRGQSESRYSYESFPGAGPEKRCELDTSLHVLYFSYSE